MPESTFHLPADDLTRKLTVSTPDAAQKLPHLGIVGDTYTITVSGKDTAGQFCVAGGAGGLHEEGRGAGPKVQDRAASLSLAHTVHPTPSGKDGVHSSS